jgi:hypothetical protein
MIVAEHAKEQADEDQMFGENALMPASRLADLTVEPDKVQRPPRGHLTAGLRYMIIVARSSALSVADDCRSTFPTTPASRDRTSREQVEDRLAAMTRAVTAWRVIVDDSTGSAMSVWGSRFRAIDLIMDWLFDVTAEAPSPSGGKERTGLAC